MMTDDRPAVTCLCPTCGRFERLRDSVACFLLQDYEPKRLLILNDARAPVLLSENLTITRDQYRPDVEIRVINNPARHITLGHKRQALLEAALTPLVAHWDDDDLYLPWHMSSATQALFGAPRAACAKARAAWLGVGRGDAITLSGPKHNIFEAQMVFRRESALRLGGYSHRVSGQALSLLRGFGQAGMAHQWEPPAPWISFICRWGDGLAHISGQGDTLKSHNTFERKNRDFGGGQELIPSGCPHLWARARLAGKFARIATEVERLLGKEAAAATSARLRDALFRKPVGDEKG